MSSSPSSSLSEIEQATHGLLFPSESEHPIEPLQWPHNAPAPASPQAVLAAKGHPADTPVQTIPFAQFFHPLAHEQDENDPAAVESMQRFQTLMSTLQTHLSAVQVYKVGHLNIDVYVIGQTQDGSIVGIQTKAVET